MATLQQAINGGQCVKSEFLIQRDEARRFIGRLDIAERGLDQVRTETLTGAGLRGVILESDYWTAIDPGRFLDDPRVVDMVSELNLATSRFNESLFPAFGASKFLEEVKETNRVRAGKGQPPQDSSAQEPAVAMLNKRHEEVKAALVGAREYMKAKYALPSELPQATKP